MRGIINSGNTWRTAYVLRLSKSRQSRPTRETKSESGNPDSQMAAVQTVRIPHSEIRIQEGTDTGLQRYSCWCPKVIAMIGKVPDTIADRSIVVPMTRKLITETRAPLAELNPAEIKAKCARFALDQGQNVKQSEKIRGAGLNDRAADTFDPLYVIARFAGQEWEQKLHTAALALANSAQSKNSGTELLRDMHAIFVLTGNKRMFTRELLEILNRPDFSLASGTSKHSALDEYKIAQLLRPYGIKPLAFRVGKQVAKGYAADDLTDPLARFVPKADVEARIQELERHDKLWDEAEELETSE